MASERYIPKALGLTDEITACDCCGKTNLKCTVALEMEDGTVVHYGRDCAGAAVFGRKSSKNAEMVALRAVTRSRVEPVIAAIRAALPQGIDAAKAAGRAALDAHGRIWWDRDGKAGYSDMRTGNRFGMTVSVSGFTSWGHIAVNFTGGVERIEMPA
jgi:hypothetical protein